MNPFVRLDGSTPKTAKQHDPFSLARSIQKHVGRLKSAGYSHPPVNQGDAAVFRVTTPQGRRLEVSVREVSTREEIGEARRAGTVI